MKMWIGATVLIVAVGVFVEFNIADWKESDTSGMENSAKVVLRLIAKSQEGYRSGPGHGTYARSFDELGKTVDADRIDAYTITDNRGYKFAITESSPTHFRIVATPISASKKAKFFITESGAIGHLD